MKNRTVVAGGGLIGLAVLAGIWLSGLFSGLGSGSGTARVDLSGSSATAEPDEDDLRQVTTTAPPQPIPDHPADDDRLPGPSPVLEIVVERDGYAVRDERDGQERLTPAKLPELAALAKQTTGNDEGIRVRIFRRESAPVSATPRLLAELKEAGVDRTEYELQPTLLKPREE